MDLLPFTCRIFTLVLLLLVNTSKGLYANSNDAEPTDASPKSLWTKDIPNDDYLDGDNETLYIDGDIPDMPIVDIASDIYALLDKYGLTAWELSHMISGGYFPTDPQDINCVFFESWKAFKGYVPCWIAHVITPVQQGVNGSLIQAALYSNEHINPENPQRVLSFGGMQWRKGEITPIAESACLAAEYGFKGTAAELTWQNACVESGGASISMTAWAVQAAALIESTNATFLTGDKMGCEIAKSEGLLRPDLPVVCWGVRGGLTEAWIDAYPGLASAIGRNPTITTTTISTTSRGAIPTTEVDIKEIMRENARSFPKNDQIYVIQSYTDPNSNCLNPPEEPGSGLAHVCAYPGTGRCDVGIRGGFNYRGICADVPSMRGGLWRGLEEMQCISRENVGFDLNLRDCPFEQEISYPVQGSELNETISGGSSVAIGSGSVLQFAIFTLLTLASILD